MDPAVHGLLQKAEACGIVVKERQREQAATDDPARGRRQRPEPDFRVELLLELAGLGFVEFQGRPRRLILGQGHRRSIPSNAEGATEWSDTCLPIVTPLNRSEEHTTALQSLMRTSYAVFCLR